MTAPATAARNRTLKMSDIRLFFCFMACFAASWICDRVGSPKIIPGIPVSSKHKVL